VLAGEAATAALLPVHRGRHNVDDLVARVTEGLPPRPVLSFADSITRIPETGTALDGRVHDFGTNAWTGVASHYFVYRRYVERSGPPRLASITLALESYRASLRGRVSEGNFDTIFQRPGEILDFARTTRRVAQPLSMALDRILTPPTALSRGVVRRGFSPLLDRVAMPAEVPFSFIFWGDASIVEAIEKRGADPDAEIPPLSQKYLEKLAEATERDGARLVIAHPAMPPSVLAAWRKNGRLAPLEALFAEVAARHRNVVVLPTETFADYDSLQFRDPFHLKPGPKAAYGARLAAKLAGILDE